MSAFYNVQDVIYMKETVSQTESMWSFSDNVSSVMTVIFLAEIDFPTLGSETSDKTRKLYSRIIGVGKYKNLSLVFI